MINAVPKLPSHAKSWQTALKQLVTDPAELLTLLELDESWLAPAQHAASLFPLRVSRSFIARMNKGDINDPLLRQVLPLDIEFAEKLGYSKDPLHEKAVNPVSGLLHKYQGRVLLTIAGACAIHCRYCFRRHFPYADNTPGLSGWQAAIHHVAKDGSIKEVIFSGGDPLIAPDHFLQSLANQIAEIPHVKILRIHTRIPVVIPERICEEFINWFTRLRLQPVMVLHINHAQEIDSEVIQALQRLRQAGVTLLNQSVLLKSVNDSAESLANLSEKLFNAGVLPYYLHLLDKVQGAAHFAVSRQKARQIMQQLVDNLPGYLVPKLVCEQAGARSKIPQF